MSDLTFWRVTGWPLTGDGSQWHGRWHDTFDLAETQARRWHANDDIADVQVEEIVVEIVNTTTLAFDEPAARA